MLIRINASANHMWRIRAKILVSKIYRLAVNNFVPNLLSEIPGMAQSPKLRSGADFLIFRFDEIDPPTAQSSSI